MTLIRRSCNGRPNVSSGFTDEKYEAPARPTSLGRRDREQIEVFRSFCAWRSYRIPGVVICGIPPIIGTQLAAIVVHMKIHGSAAISPTTTSAMKSALAHAGQTSGEAV